MEWILYILGGIILIAVLWAIGLIPEFITMIIATLVPGVICGVGALLFGWEFDAGWKVGIIVGIILYTLYCIGRIINPNITIEFFTDGSHQILSERWDGVIGLIVVIGSVIYSIFFK